MAKKDVQERRYHSKHKGKLIRLPYKNFHTGPPCFTLVLRCYTRDNLSFIHLCCSRRYA